MAKEQWYDRPPSTDEERAAMNHDIDCLTAGNKPAVLDASQLDKMPTRAADFFAATVRPTVDEFFGDPRNVRRGRLAAIVLYHMADYWDQEHDPTDKSLSNLQKSLIGKCPEFGIIRDIADASKHDRLTRPSQIPRQLSNSDQIERAKGFFEASFNEGAFNEASIVMVTLDDKTKKPLAGYVQAALSMWESMLL
ncbi:MAG: hypothetical protein WDN46_24095 [Methylocella sp.]